MANGRKTGGRTKGTPNKMTAEIRSAAQLHGSAAIAKLVSLMDEGDTHQVQLAAARELLDRGYGRPMQSVAVSDDQTPRYVALLPEVCETADEWERQYARYARQTPPSRL